MSSSSLNLSLILQAVDRLSGPLRNINDRIDQLHGPVRRLGAELNRTFHLSGLGNIVGGLRQVGSELTQLTFKLTAIAGGVAWAFKRNFVDVAAEFESLAISLESIEGSSEKGRKALAWITEFAKKTPLELDTTTKAYMLLKNAGINPVTGALQALVDSNAKINGTQENMIEITRQLGQAWMKNKLQMEEINVLTERGIKVIPLLSQAMHKNEQAVMDMVGKGRIGKTAIKALLEAMGKDAAGASEKQSRSWAGMISTLSDTWKGFVNRIMNSGGAFPYLKGQLDALIKRLEFFQTAAGMAQIDAWGKQLTEALQSIVAFGRQAWAEINKLTGLVGGFGNLAKLAFTGIAAIMAGPLIAGIGMVMLGFVQLITFLAANPMVATFVAVASAVYLIYANWDKLVARFQNGIALVRELLVNGLMQAIDGVTGGIKLALGAIVDGVTGIARAMKNLLTFQNPFAGGEKLFPMPSGPALGGATGKPLATLKPGMQKSEVGGKVQIEIKGPGKVTSMKSDNPAVPLEVSRGLTMLGAY